MNKKEVYRYLKCPKDINDEKLDKIIDNCIEECEKKIQPKSIYKIVPCSIIDDTVTLGELILKSKFLSKNLAKCTRAVLFAATLGVEADTIIRKSSMSDMAKATVFQGVFAQKIEEFIDAKELEILKITNAVRLCPRFSPGYADLHLETQRQFFASIEITKRIGVSLTDSCLMTPTKSVTAIIGIVDKEEN